MRPTWAWSKAFLLQEVFSCADSGQNAAGEDEKTAAFDEVYAISMREMWICEEVYNEEKGDKSD